LCATLAIAGATLVACSPSSLVDVETPNTVVDPSQIGTVSGAIQLRAGALASAGGPIAGYYGSNLITFGGLFTDELAETNYTQPGFDERRVNDPTYANTGGSGIGLYIFLYRTRSRIQVARQALQLYAANAADAPKAWQGELYALEGFTALWLAEYYCSGIPLTSVALVGESKPSRGLTTQELFTAAVALFDSAMTTGADSVRYVNLARVGKGRALLGLGNFAAADSAVRDVPTDFVYNAEFTPSGDYTNQFAQYGNTSVRVQNNEGHNGLIWYPDPRTGVVKDTSASDMLRPSKYNVSSDGSFTPLTSAPGTPVRVADGLEARLIQAEAALAAGDGSLLTILNALRATCIGSAACAPVPGITTTNLPDTLSDPGSASTREDLLFAERAKWLYLTGHRQGDLRRLAHVYHRNPNTLWPTGTMVAPPFPPLYSTPLPANGTLYGNDVVFGPDPSERVTNPQYGGCYDYNP